VRPPDAAFLIQPLGVGAGRRRYLRRRPLTYCGHPPTTFRIQVGTRIDPADFLHKSLQQRPRLLAVSDIPQCPRPFANVLLSARSAHVQRMTTVNGSAQSLTATRKIYTPRRWKGNATRRSSPRAQGDSRTRSRRQDRAHLLTEKKLSSGRRSTAAEVSKRRVCASARPRNTRLQPRAFYSRLIPRPVHSIAVDTN
jgi:hypothetical protein